MISSELSKERLLEAQLHQHQQDREPDAAGRAHQTRLVGEEIAPGERYRTWTRRSTRSTGLSGRRGGGNRQGTVPQKRRRDRRAAGFRRQQAEIKAITKAAASTAATRIWLISTGNSVSWRISE